MRGKTHFAIDLDALEENVELIRKIYPAKILAMVKADAYGHGQLPVVQTLVEKCGVGELGVATLREALHLRHELPHLRAEIYVFSELGLWNQAGIFAYGDKRLIPVISNLTDLKIFIGQMTDKKRQFPFALKINVGMNRLGIDLSEIPDVIKILKSFNVKDVEHLMGHLAVGDQLSDEAQKLNQHFLSQFLHAKQQLADAGVVIHKTSLANSGGIHQKIGLDQGFTHCRPGIQLYGPAGFGQGKMVGRLKVEVIKKKWFYQGDLLGYGGYTLPTSQLVFTLALGYGDGVGRFWSGLKKSFEGIPGEILGRVNMDMIFLGFKEEDAKKADKRWKVGDCLLFWGENPAELEGMADQLGTIPYELTCHMGQRIPKVILSNNSYKMRLT